MRIEAPERRWFPTSQPLRWWTARRPTSARGRNPGAVTFVHAAKHLSDNNAGMAKNLLLCQITYLPYNNNVWKYFFL